MDLSSNNTGGIKISFVLTHLYNFTIFIFSLLFLLCYRFPKVTFFVGMLLSYIAISTILDVIVRAFFSTPVHRFPLVLLLIFIAIAWYLHRKIKKYDNFELREAFRAAELAAAEQARFLRAEEQGSSQRGSSSSSSEDDDGHDGPRGERASLGGLDLDVWQGGERRRGWTPRKP